MENMNLTKLCQMVGIPFRGEDVIVKGVSSDTRTIKPGDLFVALVGQNFDGHDFIEEARARGAVAVMISRPVKTTLPVIQVSDTLLGLGQLARAYRKIFTGTMVAITGSSGKTTVKEMTANIFRQEGETLATQGNLNNAIGVPLTLLRLNSNYRYAVIEMGANHSGEIAYTMKIAAPHISLINNIAPAHLEGFGSIEGVARAKGEIYQELPKDGVAIINLDDKFADSWDRFLNDQRRVTFGITDRADIFATDLQCDGENRYQFKLHTPIGNVEVKLPFAGKHNVANALAATAATYAAGISLSNIKKGLETVPSTKGRLIQLRGKNGIRLIDDTYNANPGSVKAAMEVLAHYTGQRVLVLGDLGELGEYAEHYHREIGEQARKLGIQNLYACGKLTQLTVNAFGDDAHHFADKQALIEALIKQLRPEATVLVKGSRSAKMEQIVAALSESTNSN